MSRSKVTRRQFVQTSAGLAAAVSVPYWFSSYARAEESKNDRPIMGSIGVGSQGSGIARRASVNGADIVAICDVDRSHADKLKQDLANKAEIYEDYRKLLERPDVEAVTIGTPDHWHTAIALAALDAGKHVYCEKPLTLTIDEGKQLVKAVKRTGKTFQVGTQQRGDQWDLFARAVATVRSGQLGKIKKVTVQVPLSTKVGGPFEAKPIPQGLNWDFWLGQAPKVDYCPERCHWDFRWWYEYSGGVMTDWGAHHMDVAQWALDVENSGPKTIDGSKTVLPNIAGGFNTPREPHIEYTYPNDIQLTMVAGDEGVLFEGESGKIFVNRGRITGKPIEDQDADPKVKKKIMQDILKLYKGNLARFGDHMGNFFEGFKHKLPTISDVESQHRSVSACHLGNISIRLGRKIEWDPVKEEIVGDAEANAMLKRTQRAPYEIQYKA